MPEKSLQQKPGLPSSKRLEELKTLAGQVDLLDYMIREKLPLTQQTFIDLNWFGEKPRVVEDPDERRVLELLPPE
jgi:hypothetical protein